ncbi:phosphoribosylanthranilate isomerase [Paenibacillus sp. GCM10027627]|uniref:phosphoribosylanthranilate isomerase n=1 Tax=unclassified Paenibacillus TaxID=185978 RepID=UPI003636364A
MSARIKICGLRDVQTVELLDGLPIREIGLVFAPSKRQVDKETAARLVRAIRKLTTAYGASPRAVGVFVNASLKEIDELMEEAPLDVAQLHGDESPEFCAQLRLNHPELHIWRVLSMKGKGDISDEPLLANEAKESVEPYSGLVDAILIDAPGGGTGQPFNWSLIDAYKKAAAAKGLPLYVAGGLTPDNVQELLRTYAPDGIDVSSGVETEGQKDIEKIRLFVRRVMEA